MNTMLFFAVFAALATVYFFIGLYASRDVKTNTDYFLANRDLGLFSITFTLIATQLGGGMLLGTAERAYAIGYWGILYTLGMSLGFLILGLGLAARMRTLNVSTTAELFETRYGSPALRKVASLLSIATMSGILVGQVIASRSLLVGMGITNEYIFLAFWAFVIIYTMVGGLKAVVLTDVAQVWVIILVFSGIFIYGIFTEPASFFSSDNLMAMQKQFPIKDFTTATLLATILLPALFSLIEQDLAQRFFAARNQKVAALSALLSSLFLLLFSCIPIYFGMKAKIAGLVMATGASPLIPIIEFLTSDLIVVFAVCGIIAAITSTADSLLCAVSSNLAQDFDFSFLGLSPLKVSQIVTLVTGISAIWASYFVGQDIIGVLIGSYEISVSCLLVPLLYSYFRTNLNKNAAIGSILGGLVGFIVLRFLPLPIPKEIATLAISWIGYRMGNRIR